jgi:DNA repair protein RecO (recombination protein O)
MLHKTRGLVLNYIKYSETSIITKIYTEELGLQTYIVNGVRSKTSKNKIALFQPLTLLDLIVYYKQNSQIHRISEARLSKPFKSINTDARKSSIAIFLIELLGKTLKEEGANHLLFKFLYNALMHFDETENNFENFHLHFLLKLSSYLGFEPSGTAHFANARALSKEMKDFLEELMASDFSTIIKTSNTTRRVILEHLLNFYSEHVENFGEMKSIKILKELIQ